MKNPTFTNTYYYVKKEKKIKRKVFHISDLCKGY